MSIAGKKESAGQVRYENPTKGAPVPRTKTLRSEQALTAQPNPPAPLVFRGRLRVPPTV